MVRNSRVSGVVKVWLGVSKPPLDAQGRLLPRWNTWLDGTTYDSIRVSRERHACVEWPQLQARAGGRCAVVVSESLRPCGEVFRSPLCPPCTGRVRWQPRGAICRRAVPYVVSERRDMQALVACSVMEPVLSHALLRACITAIAV